MTAEELLVAGELEGALASLQQRVRDTPQDPGLQVFLFQLLAVLGEWQRALHHLELAAEYDHGNKLLLQEYCEPLNCETVRSEVFRGRQAPGVLGEHDAWLALLAEALKLTAQGQYAESQKLRWEAFDAAPMTPGALQIIGHDEGGDRSRDVKFEMISDWDTRLGPVLEVIVGGRYLWVPFARVAEVAITAPRDLCDFVWVRAEFRWCDGRKEVGFIPTRYAGSEEHSDNRIRLSRRTECIEPVEGLRMGIGQRMFMTECSDFHLQHVHYLRLAHGAAERGGAPGGVAPASGLGT